MRPYLALEQGVGQEFLVPLDKVHLHFRLDCALSVPLGFISKLSAQIGIPFGEILISLFVRVFFLLRLFNQ